MKKTMTRIAACSLAVLIAFNTFAIPKSKAVAFGSQFASAVTAAFMTATGFSMNASGDWNGTSADMYIADRLDSFLRDFAEARDMTKAQFEELIYHGVEIVHGGLVKISSGAASLLSGFSDWLIDKLGLVSAGDSVVVGDTGVTVLDEPFVLGFGTEEVVGLGFVSAGTIFAVGQSYVLSNGTTVSTNQPSGPYTSTEFYVNGKEIACITNNNLSGRYYTFASYLDADGQWSSCIYIFMSLESSAPSIRHGLDGDFSILGEDVRAPFVVGLGANYETPPLVSEQHAMVIDTGMTFEDEQTFIDSILAGVVSGTLNPTYDVELENRDTVIPGEVTDTQAGILSWVKRIAQSIISLPQAIADKFAAFPQSIAKAVEGIFVPDAALTTEITDTFSEKFAFVPQLHALGVDLLNLKPDSEPPVIWIHLEDTEGSINYGGTVKALDMSWYERYKEDGDRIIGGFLWLGFLWALFMRVSDIINGAGMAYVLGQPTIYTPEPPNDAPRLEGSRKRGKR